MARREAERLMRAGAVFELSPFSKFRISGTRACAALQVLCTNNIDRPVGNVIYSLMLNARGGIETECTLTRIDDDTFLVVTGAATRVKDFYWMRERLANEIDIEDITDDYVVLGVMGPNAASLLLQLTEDGFDPAQFPYLSSHKVPLGDDWIRTNRVSYVGEKGWELYIPVQAAERVIEKVIQFMPRFDMTFAGHFCLDSCRLEKGFVHWGHDIGPDDDPLSADLMFAVRTSDSFDFIGKQALVSLAKNEVSHKRVLFEVEHLAPLLLHDEPVYCGGRLIGRTTSGGLGFRTNKALSMAYIESAKIAEHENFEIEVAGVRLPATILSEAPYDPAGNKMREN